VVRPGRARDIDAMQALEIDAGRRFAEIGFQSVADDEPFAPDELVAYIDCGRAWVAVISQREPTAPAPDAGEGTPIGYAVASVVDDEAHLDQVSVAAAHGGRGVGRALTEAVCAWAMANGFECLTLTTFRDVPWNGPLYARWGFEALDENHLGPQLAALRRREAERGLDRAGPRVAMRRRLVPPPDAST
jgi:GNAT superfamily N-acetyltransferase